MTDDVWDFQEEPGDEAATDLTGFKVEATDGSVGKVGRDSYEVGATRIVVDTGVWVFGKQVLLPAGRISSVDVEERKVYVDRTKEEIKESPEYSGAPRTT
jgi:ribosomal 30S subunit maturation factor RimM